MYWKLKIFWYIVDNLCQWSWSWRIKRSESRRTTRKRCTRITWNIYMYYPLYYDDYIIVFEKYIFTFYICTLCLLQMIKSNFSKFKFWGKLCSAKVSEEKFEAASQFEQICNKVVSKNLWTFNLSSSRWRLHILMN